MNISARIIKTSLKSALLATILCVLVIFALNQDDVSTMIPFFPVIYIIFLIFSLIGICFTIVPFYYLGKNNPLSTIFKRYFPIYAIVFFILCIILTIMSGFMAAMVVLIIAYITAMFAWIWFFNEKNEQKKQILNQ